jgi:hypothetical protein
MNKDQERAIWDQIEKYPVMYQMYAGRFVRINPDAMFRYLKATVEAVEKAGPKVAGK